MVNRTWCPVTLSLLGIASILTVLLLMRPVPLPTLSPAPAAIAEIAPAPPAGAQVLLAAEPLDALQALIESPQAQPLRAEIDSACRVPVLLVLDGRRRPDPRRDPALAELKRRCALVPVPSMYVPMEEMRAPLNERNASPIDALAAIRSAQTAEELLSAWLDAYASRALPQHEIFPDGRRLLPSEAEMLMRAALDVRECERLAACGPGSLITLRVCALHGCTPGSDLRMAYHEALAPRDFEALIEIHRWLKRIRKA